MKLYKPIALINILACGYLIGRMDADKPLWINIGHIVFASLNLFFALMNEHKPAKSKGSEVNK